jgi:DNA polymerase-3 subunit chi
MAAIHFYHLTTSPLIVALPKLLEKAYSSGFRILLLAQDADKTEQLNQLLWSYHPLSFLPHGSLKEPHQAMQPILVSDRVENSNNANVLFITSGLHLEQTEGFERIIDMFDGNDNYALGQARARWKAYKDAGVELVYNKQTSGGWEKG